MSNRSLSPCTHEVISIGKESFDVEKGSSLYRMLTELEDSFSKISSNTSLKRIGFSVYERLFEESLLNLNTIYKDSHKNTEKLKYPCNLPYTSANNRNILDDKFCCLKFQESILKMSIDFVALYKEFVINEDSDLLEEYRFLCKKIYEDCFLNLVSRENLNLDLDLYNWLMDNNFQSKPRKQFDFNNDFNQSYTYTKDLSEHFSGNEIYIVEKIIESVIQTNRVSEDSMGNKYTQYENRVNMPNPLNDKYAELAMQVDNLVKSLR